MTKVVNIDDGRTLILPEQSRHCFGMRNGGQVALEQTAQPRLRGPGRRLPGDFYAGKRVTKFMPKDEETSAGFRFKDHSILASSPPPDVHQDD